MDSIGFQKSANSFQRVSIAVILTDVSLFCPRLTIWLLILKYSQVNSVLTASREEVRIVLFFFFDRKLVKVDILQVQYGTGSG